MKARNPRQGRPISALKSCWPEPVKYCGCDELSWNAFRVFLDFSAEITAFCENRDCSLLVRYLGFSLVFDASLSCCGTVSKTVVAFQICRLQMFISLVCVYSIQWLWNLNLRHMTARKHVFQGFRLFQKRPHFFVPPLCNLSFLV